MPTNKKRVGFIPRNSVLEIINKLSFESNLSNSKIINILVEEALYNRGIFNIKTGKVNYEKTENQFIKGSKTNLKNTNSEIFINKRDNSFGVDNPNEKEIKYDFLDSEIYEKFIMFLQFQEKMNQNKNI